VPGNALEIRLRPIAVDGVALHCLEAGPDDGTPVIVLHGFPECSYGWHRQLPALVAAGYRVIAPDQRGYNRSSKPRGATAYDLDALAADILGLADRLQLGRVRLVGHDWGASVAWWLATFHPERLDRIVVINAPHPAQWRAAMRDDPAQRRKSWYVHAFRLPWLPEAAMRAGNFRALARGLVDSSRPGTFDEAQLARYREAWAQPGALTAMLNWYRALLRRRMPDRLPRITVPVLMIWGVDDQFGERSVAQASIDQCDHGRVVYVDAATHWVHHEEPDRVNALLLEFLR